MSKLLKQDQRLDAQRRERKHRAPADPPHPTPVQQAPPLLLTYTPSPEQPSATPRQDPVPAAAVSPRRWPREIGVAAISRSWKIRLGLGLGLATGLAACFVLSAQIQRATTVRVTATPPMSRTSAPTPIALSPAPAAPRATANPSPGVPTGSGADLRLRQMDRAMEDARLADARRVMALMDAAMRDAARAYAVTRSVPPQARLPRAELRS